MIPGRSSNWILASLYYTQERRGRKRKEGKGQREGGREERSQAVKFRSLPISVRYSTAQPLTSKWCRISREVFDWCTGPQSLQMGVPRRPTMLRC